MQIFFKLKITSENTFFFLATPHNIDQLLKPFGVLNNWSTK